MCIPTTQKVYTIFTCLCKTTLGQKSLFVNGLKLYNSIPGYIKREDMSRNVFKKSVIQYIKDGVPSLLPSSN
jgi:hypothetical protein